LILPPDDLERLRRYLDLQSDVLRLQFDILSKAQQDTVDRQRTLAAASRAAPWVGGFVVAAVVVGALWHDVLSASLGQSPVLVHGSSSQFPVLKVESIGTILGLLGGLVSIVLSTRGLLSRVLVVSLTSATLLAIWGISQIVNYHFGPWDLRFWLWVVGATVLGSYALKRVIAIGAARVSDAEYVASKDIESTKAEPNPRRFLDSINKWLNPAHNRLLLIVFVALPILGIAGDAVDVIAWEKARQLSSVTHWIYLAGDTAFGVWLVWALMLPWARLVLGTMAFWLVGGYVGWNVLTLGIPSYGFVVACAGCSVGVAIVLLGGQGLFRAPWILRARVGN
jgi:hypothetical protein